MNWKEIKREYPKAWRLLMKWFGYKKDITVSMELSKIFMPERKLYDFFDEQEIYIRPTLRVGKLFKVRINWGFYIMQIIAGITTSKKYFSFYTRIKAEEAAFLKAFEILENKQNDKA